MPRYPDAIRDEAFDLYCTGLSRRRVAVALQEKYGKEHAPHATTVKRWMSQERWTERKKVIRKRAMELEDRQRVLEVIRLMQGFEEVPFKSKCEAVRTVVQGQKLVKELMEEVEVPISDKEIRMIVEHFFKVLHADEEVGPVLERRRYHIDAALERSRHEPP